MQPLATGGMARIYIARTTGIGAFERHVVLKLILPERAEDDIAVKMFLDEARLAALLNHQNVAQVFEVGEDSGIHYLAMEYVHGQDLRAFLAKAGGAGVRVPLELGLTIVAGAAAGLNHAHERRAPDGSPLGIVHRDVSPSNIMVGYDGAVKMLDFGIAKAAQRSVETVSGIIKGKFAYMSPEQCRGREVDRRSDVFSLGIILYEVTTQHRCFRADSDFDTMHRIVTGDVVKPSRLVPNYPAALEAILMRALSVDVHQRYQSAGLLLEALESYSLNNRSPLSTMGLGRFMREMFGEVVEPWLQHGAEQYAAGHISEGTISNTEGGGAAQSRLPPSASQPPPMGQPGPSRLPGVPQPSLPARNFVDAVRSGLDEPPDEWERSRSYPVASMPAIASTSTMPPESVMAARLHDGPRVPANPLVMHGRPRRDSQRPPPSSAPFGGTATTLPGMTVAPHGSSPSMPFPSSAKDAIAMAPTQLEPLGLMPGGGQLPLPPPRHETAPVVHSFGANPGSSVSHSHLTPYPQVPADLDGYTLKPGRRPLYIGVMLAAIGVVVAVVIGSGGDDGPSMPTVDEPVTEPMTGVGDPAVTPSGTNAAVTPEVTPAIPVDDKDKPDKAAPGPGTDDKVGVGTIDGKTKPGTTDIKPAPPDDKGDKGDTGDKPPDVAAKVPGTRGEVAIVPPDKGDKPPDDVQPPAPTMIKVIIKSDPDDADVFHNGKRVGRTPFEATLPLGGGSTAYTLRVDRYLDETVTVKQAKDFETTVHFAKKREKPGRTDRPDKPDKADKTPPKPKGPCQKKGAPVNPFVGTKLPPCD